MKCIKKNVVILKFKTAGADHCSKQSQKRLDKILFMH